MKKEQGVPECIGVIVDGNRRWARERGLSALKGHQAGYEKLKEMTDWAQEAGISHVVAYVFSIENWNRSKDEVGYLMDLVGKVFTKDLEHFQNRNAKIIVAGDLSLCSEKVRMVVRDAEEKTGKNTGITLVLAFSYGGRDEIVSAINRILSQDPTPKKVDKEELAKNLWTAGAPDPDLIIRTSGEMRLSNFLSWQCVYSELFFPKFHFPDFTKQAFFAILEEFSQRQRRFGK